MITIDRAIKIIEDNIKAKPFGMNHEYFDALQLGSEALHRVKQLRGGLLVNPDSGLQGETNED